MRKWREQMRLKHTWIMLSACLLIMVLVACGGGGGGGSTGSSSNSNNNGNPPAEVANAVASVQGIGMTCPFPAELNLNVNEGLLTYSYQDIFFQATSMAITSTVNGTVVVEGEGDLNGDPEHTFTATIKDGGSVNAQWLHIAVNNGGCDDAMGFEIDGDPALGTGFIPTICGSGFTLEDGNVSGIGMTCPFPAELNLDVLSDGEGSLTYTYEDAYFAATSINAPSIVNGTATITGTGSLNGEGTHSFTAIVEDGSPDKMGFEINGEAFPVPGAGPLMLTDGAGFTVQE